MNNFPRSTRKRRWHKKNKKEFRRVCAEIHAMRRLRSRYGLIADLQLIRRIKREILHNGWMTYQTASRSLFKVEFLGHELFGVLHKKRNVILTFLTKEQYEASTAVDYGNDDV